MIPTHESSNGGGGCAAHLSAVGATMRGVAAHWLGLPTGAVVAAEPWGRLERIAEGVWAVISTPLEGDRTTLSNGGLIAGTNGVIAIEGFMTADGARWLSAQSRTLTGLVPSHVAVTHYHGDHANGVAGYSAEMGLPAVHTTGATRLAVMAAQQPDPARTSVFQGASVMDPTGATPIDLGGRTVRLVPRAGHTASDVTIELDDPPVIFCGDLVWNGMFPNYVDTTPSELNRTVRALRRPGATWIPGHGPVVREADLARYIDMLEAVGAAAAVAHGRGQTAADAAAAFTIPPSLGEWTLFSRAFHQRAFEAWYRELSSAR
ncbi:MAG: MBL fold metallo-hydrolase [Gemmatimonadota bacterium]